MKKKMILASYKNLDMMEMPPQEQRVEEEKLLLLASYNNAVLQKEHDYANERTNFFIRVEGEDQFGDPRKEILPMPCQPPGTAAKRRNTLLLLGD